MILCVVFCPCFSRVINFVNVPYFVGFYENGACVYFRCSLASNLRSTDLSVDRCGSFIWVDDDDDDDVVVASATAPTTKLAHYIYSIFVCVLACGRVCVCVFVCAVHTF